MGNSQTQLWIPTGAYLLRLYDINRKTCGIYYERCLLLGQN